MRGFDLCCWFGVRVASEMIVNNPCLRISKRHLLARPVLTLAPTPPYVQVALLDAEDPNPPSELLFQASVLALRWPLAATTID